MEQEKPIYLVIEGIDGAGKETQTRLLKEYLKSLGKNVITQSFPNYGTDGCKPVQMYLDGKLSKTANEVNAYQSSVLFAVDRFCTMTQLIKNITKDSVVVFDRYVSSNMLHQGGKIHNDEDLEKYLKWLENFEFEVMKIPRPDKIFFLSVPPEISMELIKKRKGLKSQTEKDIQESDENHLKNAYNTGMKISKMFGWEIIDCVDKEKNQMRTKEDISKEIQQKVNQILNIK
jgi:dTMP kinase